MTFAVILHLIVLLSTPVDYIGHPGAKRFTFEVSKDEKLQSWQED